MNKSLQNISNNGREIKLFLRNPDGKQEIETINDFFPYFYEENEENNDSIGFDGTKLKKHYVTNPKEVREQRTSRSWESDINPFSKRYMIDKIDTIEKSPTRVNFIDIEVLCYDKETEILTDQGWKYFKDLDKTQKVATLNKKGFLEFNIPKLIINKKYNGKMYHIKSNKVDICVTEKHNLFCANRKDQEKTKKLRKNLQFSLQKVNEIYKKDKKRFFKTNINWRGSNPKYFYLKGLLLHKGFYYKKIHTKKIPMKEWLEFFGFWMAEGSTTHYRTKHASEHRIDVIQKKYPQIIFKLKKYLIKWGFNPHICVRKDGCLHLSVHSKQLYLYLSQFGKSKDKFIPTETKELSSKLLIVFLKYFILGDGSKDKKIIYTASEKLSDDFQEIILKCGFSSRVYSHITHTIIYGKKYKGKIWLIFIDYVHSYPMVRKKDWSVFNYSGIVYSVMVGSPHVIVTRRNGKIVLNGNCHELPRPKETGKLKDKISCITVYDNYTKVYDTFFLGDYDSEYNLLTDFIKKIKENNCDLMVGWNFVYFDFYCLCLRYPDFAKAISPIGQERWIPNESVKFPSGISLIDYKLFYKKIYKGLKSYSLDNVLEHEFGTGKTHPIKDFTILCPELKAHNLEDVVGMVKIEEKCKLIELYDEIRRNNKINWEDLVYNLRIVESRLFKTAKTLYFVLPNKKKYDEGSKKKFEAAYREVIETGRFENISYYDLSGAYHYTIINLCLDTANIMEEEQEDTIKVNVTDRITGKIINTYNVKQNPNTLLPLTVKEVLIEKNKFKKLKTNTLPDDPNYKDIEVKYDAIKAIALSLWGVIGNNGFRYFDKRIAAMITSVVRDLAHYVKDKLDEKGIKIVQIDTDGLFLNCKENLSDYLNGLIQEWSKDRFNKKVDITFDYEGIFTRIYISCDCHYVGDLMLSSGKIKRVVKGVEIIRSSSSIFEAKFQKDLIDKVLDNEPQDKIEKFILSEMKRIKTLPIEAIAFPVQLSRPISEYKTYMIRKVKDKVTGEITEKRFDKKPYINVSALLNTQKIISFKKHVGNSYFFIYVIQEKEIIPMAFDENKNKHIENIAYDKMVERSILNKVSVIFKALKWDSPVLFPKKVRKTKKTSTIPLKQVRIENKGSLDPKEDKGVDNVEKEEIKPFWEETESNTPPVKTIKFKGKITKIEKGNPSLCDEELTTFYEE